MEDRGRLTPLSLHPSVAADAEGPWIAPTVDGPLPYRICDWRRDYSRHATLEDAKRALPAARAVAEAFRTVRLDACGRCGGRVLVDVATGACRCAAGCGWNGVVLRRLR